MRLQIEHVDGSMSDVTANLSKIEDGVLRCRVSGPSDPREEWVFFPIVNIKSWTHVE